MLTKTTIQKEEKEKLGKIIAEAAKFNKEQQLYYERVLFCETDEQFFEEQFNEESATIFNEANEDKANFGIMFTKIDHDRFNLKKYVLSTSDKEISSQAIISFI